MSREIHWNDAIKHLSDADPGLRPVLERFPDERIRTSGDAFQVLANSIVGQQISVKAAASIFSRTTEVLGSWTPQVVVAASAQDLRGAGLSVRKVEYLQGIARAFLDKTVNPERWHQLDDESVLRELVSLRGVGRWTAEMMLIFHLQRPDILPLDDVGLLQSAARAFDWEYPFPPDRLRDRAESWRPWRTVAVWCLWRLLDGEPVVY